MLNAQRTIAHMRREKSCRFDGRRYVNPSGTAGQPFTAVPRMLLERRTPWPLRIDEAPPRLPPLEGADAVVAFIGHVTFLIRTAAILIRLWASSLSQVTGWQ